MKICFISPLFAPAIVGGAEQYAKNLCDRLAIDHDVVVITSNVPFKNYPESNYRVIRIWQGNIDSLYNMTAKEPGKYTMKKLVWHAMDYWNVFVYLKVKKILEKEKPDIVHTNGVKGFSPLIFSAIKNSAIPHIHSLNDYELISPHVILFKDGKIMKKFGIIDKAHMKHAKKYANQIDSVIAPSKFILEFHKKMGFFKSTKTHVISHGTKFEHTKNKTKDQKQFIYFGQIIENKGIQTAIRAIILQKYKDIVLHIVGKGSYLHTAKKIAQNDPRIVFHGYLDDDILEKLFEKCSYCIVPSIWYEPFGMIIIEAMSKGMPIIASKIGAIPELVHEGVNGFLFEPGDHKSLSQIIENTQQNKEYDNIVSNAISFAKEFSIQNQVNKTINVYRNILKK